MRVSSFLSLAVATLAARTIGTQATPEADRAIIVGGYTSVKITPELRALIFKSLKDETAYADNAIPRVCVSTIQSVAQQVVAGMNYRFTTSACDIRKTLLLQTNATPTPAQVAKQLGQCKTEFARSCVEVDAVITVYRALDDTTHLSNVVTTNKPVAASTADRVHVHAAEV